MAVMARDTWTDERLDDLNHRVDEGFKEMREEFRGVRSEMREEFRGVRAEMGEGFGGVRGELQEMRAEMAAGRRTMIQATAAIWASSMVGFLGVIATILATS
jgi:hypothetical protein